MAETATLSRTITLGDPVPRFSAQTLTGTAFDLHVSAGRWVVLSFLGAPDNPRAEAEIVSLQQLGDLLDEEHMVVKAIFAAPPPALVKYAAFNSRALTIVSDADGSVTRSFGAAGMPRTIVLDPMLRAIADIPWDFPQGHAASVANCLRGLPKADESAGVPLYAPALIVPRVFDFALCDFLIDFHEKNGAQESGFLLDTGGKTSTVVDHRLKRRRDVPVAHPDVRDVVRAQVVRRLLPEIERFFQFRATRMDRYVIACYDAKDGGHFHRHRDNVNAGAEHRRFALTINLNTDYDGGDLVFAEFGTRAYRAPCGGAILFSCGALHQVTPVTRGRRYAFLAFLYDENDAAKRAANNVRLHDSEARYDGNWDRLYADAGGKPAAA